jgi:hypothetical protein
MWMFQPSTGHKCPNMAGWSDEAGEVWAVCGGAEQVHRPIQAQRTGCCFGGVHLV